MFDAIGFSINKLKQFSQGQTDYHVLATILTDGAENVSRKFSGNDIKKFIEELKQLHWTFTNIGTDYDIEKIAKSISINNTMFFAKSLGSIRKMFD